MKDDFDRALLSAIAAGLKPLLAEIEQHLAGNLADKIAFDKMAAEAPRVVLSSLLESGAVVRSAETAHWPVTARVEGSMQEPPFAETYFVDVKIGEQIFSHKIRNDMRGSSDDRDFIQHFSGWALNACLMAAAEPLREPIARAMWQAKRRDSDRNPEGGDAVAAPCVA